MLLDTLYITIILCKKFEDIYVSFYELFSPNNHLWGIYHSPIKSALLFRGVYVSEFSVYQIRGSITMPNVLHYACFIIDNKESFLNLSLSKILFHDEMLNNGHIIESDYDIQSIIKNNICYIFILSKVMNDN